MDSESVILHIYSISERVNRFSLMFGLGLYHTAVEVYGKEHSFIAHPFKFTGIVSTTPKTAAYIYQEGLNIGQTKMNKQTVGHVLRKLGKIFTGSSYHLLYNNCNHFANEFIKRLCKGKLPAYINRAANSVCCLPFLDTIFSARTDSERFFVEVLYLTCSGDMTCVMNILDVDQQTNLSRYISYIEASFEDHSVPKCLPYYPVIKSYNPFTPSNSIVELIKKNLCTNFIFIQAKAIYDFAFDLYEELKSRNLNNITLSNYTAIVISEPIIENDMSSDADYSTDIHRYLNQLQYMLIEAIGQPILSGK
ncbi:unnamed protein product [Rotaria sp. Silwood1]|nr:unnamed protein product [Rotaria sp. Silwood1]CAF3342745.1 unnamed protein product [Rotaria sp. Silwood1]CAF3342752.1 unnamed protein product [Rotaria sp. Silwood1]CAF4492498.1 unnamed protein product [Rotaria sp. Silwood1]CAF4575196.1 unnamed protein product [Rotaria sp. Silwood1]